MDTEKAKHFHNIDMSSLAILVPCPLFSTSPRWPVSYAQTKGLGWALIAVGATLRSRGGEHPSGKAIWQGYQRGKAAAWLLGEDYDRLLNEPLEVARKRLGITPPTIYDSIPAEARDGAVPGQM